MELRQAFRLKDYPRLAFVGAGGKTTALFQLAGEMESPLMIAATTHLAVAQTQLADQHFILQSIADTNLLDGLPLAGVVLLTGAIRGRRTMGLSSAIMDWLAQYCGYHSLPLLIEADGSRQLPLKAPASHEPPIPDFVDTVVVVAGLGALGKPLTPAWVHRHERFAELAGLQVGQIVTAEALARVVTHAEGGLKNIPPGARRIVLLNQADTPQKQALAKTIAKTIIPEFQTVVISQFDVHALERSNVEIHAVHENIAGIVLAGGAAVRYGEPKQLLPWRGKPLVWHVAHKALYAGLSPVVVVGGAYTPQLRQALANLPVSLVHNPGWSLGQSTSVRVGLGAVPARNGAAIFLLADQPQVPEMLIRKLVEVHAQGLPPIVAPLVRGQRANPVLFDRSTFDDFQHLSGDAGGRKLFSKHALRWLPWHDELPILDIDTPEDYRRLLDLGE